MVSGQTASERSLPGHVKTADAEEFPFDTGKRGASRCTGGRVNPSQRYGTAPERLARSIASCVLERLVRLVPSDATENLSGRVPHRKAV